VRTVIDDDGKSMETAAELAQAHRADPSRILATVKRTLDRLSAANDPAIFISRFSDDDLRAQAAVLIKADAKGALYGVPVAVKDNIDVEGLPTTAACPAFSYAPERDATVVARLRAAGAIIVGKTNLDQFATGLVGVRSPYGVPRNTARDDLVPGGSSSGSAVAVARGIVPLALGTDTAGSGRVPAVLNNIVGLKPSCGLISTSGVTPACRSIDCVSIFALTVADAWLALSVAAGPDDTDPYSRTFALPHPAVDMSRLRIAIPRAEDRHFFGHAGAERSFDAAVARLRDLGAATPEIDISFMLDVAKLLYEGPWLAERAAAVGQFMKDHPAEVHPVTRTIIEKGWTPTAVEAFQGQYHLAGIRARTRRVFADVDALMVPTAPRPYTRDDLEADPIGPNSRLGTYTNFVNLLDLAGIAVPTSIDHDGCPHGVTFLAPAGCDARTAAIGARFHVSAQLPMGRGLGPVPEDTRNADAGDGRVLLAVVGAHLSGLPLNTQLTSAGAELVTATSTAPDYRLFELADSMPPKPGMLRVGAGEGASLAVEVWSMSPSAFGAFVAAVPEPMAIGTVRLANGDTVKGFLVESAAVVTSRDISNFGGWRAFLAARG
jgi:allophanate hydrolase